MEVALGHISNFITRIWCKLLWFFFLDSFLPARFILHVVNGKFKMVWPMYYYGKKKGDQT